MKLSPKKSFGNIINISTFRQNPSGKQNTKMESKLPAYQSLMQDSCSSAEDSFEHERHPMKKSSSRLTIFWRATIIFLLITLNLMTIRILISSSSYDTITLKNDYVPSSYGMLKQSKESSKYYEKLCSKN